MEYTIELIADYACHVGENPIWHSDQQFLYWLDIPQGKIYRFDPRTERSDLFFEGGVIGGMTIQQNGDLLLFMESGRISLLKDGRLISVIDKLTYEADKRFNDVIATPAGRVFCGTMHNKDGGMGSLYRLNYDRTITEIIAGVGIANGMGFSPGLDWFYFTDSNPAKTIYRYQFNHENETFKDETVLSHLQEAHGLPDGLVIDAEGYLWSARWDGGKVIRFDPSGEIDHEIEIPGAKQVASVTFGGLDFCDMYVTTAGGSNKEKNGKNAGALFRIRFKEIRGLPEYRSKIEVSH